MPLLLSRTRSLTLMNNSTILNTIKDHAVFIVLLVILGLSLWIVGGNLLDNWAGDRWKQENERLELELEKEKEISASAARGYAESTTRNELLRAEVQKTKELLEKSADEEIKREAVEKTEQIESLRSKLSTIDGTPDGEQLTELCKESRAIGVAFSFCANE